MDYSPWGCKTLDMTDQLTHTQTNIQKSMEIAMDFSQRQHAHVVKHSNQDIEHSQYRLGTIFFLFFPLKKKF